MVWSLWQLACVKRSENEDVGCVPVGDVASPCSQDGEGDEEPAECQR